MEELCSLCRGTGWKIKERNGLEVVERCSCVKTGKKQTLTQRACIPKRYENCTFESFSLDQCDESQKMAKRTVEYFVQLYPAVEAGLLLMGPPGTGKTHLAVAAIKSLIQKAEISCMFYDFHDLLKTLQNSYAKDTDFSEGSVLRPVLRTEVLVLDELGARKMSPWMQDTLAHILNHRYNEKLITIITSNWMDEEMLDTSNREDKKDEDTLDKRIGYRLRSRLYEMCETIQIQSSCPDHRKFLHAESKTKAPQLRRKNFLTTRKNI